MVLSAPRDAFYAFLEVHTILAGGEYGDMVRTQCANIYGKNRKGSGCSAGVAEGSTKNSPVFQSLDDWRIDAP